MTDTSRGDLWRGRIVVGVDGSEVSREAAHWAAAQAHLRHRGLTLAHAVVPTMVGSAFGVSMAPSLDMVDSLVQAAEKELRTLAGSLPCDDITMSVQVGTPSELLLEASHSAHIVVSGSRGHGGFSGLLLGSVGAQVAAHAHCPTVIFRGRMRTDAHQLVVGIDGSPHAEAALAFAFDMASREGWELIAVHAWEVPTYDLIVAPTGAVPIPLNDVADDEVRLAAEVLSGFTSDYPDVPVQERLVRSHPVDALLEASTNAAMIVVGTRGRGPGLAAVLGSTSNGVLHKATVPVAVIPLIDDGPDAA